MKIKSHIRLLLACLLLSYSSYSQSTSLRGMYINGFDNILGNTIKEDSLLQYMQDSSYNYMALYDLHTLDFSSSNDMNMLSTFISRARTNFGVQHVGAVGESFSFFRDKIKPYNNAHTNANEKFDVFNLEFEFWTTSSVQAGGYYCVNYLQQAGCNCDTAGAFHYYIGILHSIDSLAAAMGVMSETYLGWFNQGQAKQIQPIVDRILLHAYRVDNTSVFSYSKTRLGYLASNNQTVNVAPIFSSEPIFMGPWLGSHSQIEAYNKYETDFTNDNSSWKPYINILGYQWFDWGYMPKPIPGAGGAPPTISASGSTSFCVGGLVTLTASSGSNYLWSNGATTQSINASSIGSYSCNVTNNGSTQTSNIITVTVYDSPTVSVIVNPPVSNTVPLSSNTNAGSGSISSYQWKLNNTDLAGANTSDYTATASGDYNLIATNSYGCTNASAVASVTVPTCQLTIPAGTSSDNITMSSVILHWDPIVNADSIILRYKLETATDYTYIRMVSAGQTSITITGLTSSSLYSWRVKTTCSTTSSNYSTKKYFTTDDVTAVASIEAKNHTDVIFYPNPVKTTSHLTISCSKQMNALLTLTDITGKVIYSREEKIQDGINDLEIDLSTLSKGIYFIALKTETENILKKLSIE